MTFFSPYIANPISLIGWNGAVENLFKGIDWWLYSLEDLFDPAKRQSMYSIDSPLQLTNMYLIASLEISLLVKSQKKHFPPDRNYQWKSSLTWWTDVSFLTAEHSIDYHRLSDQSIMLQMLGYSKNERRFSEQHWVELLNFHRENHSMFVDVLY